MKNKISLRTKENIQKSNTSEKRNASFGCNYCHLLVTMEGIYPLVSLRVNYFSTIALRAIQI